MSLIIMLPIVMMGVVLLVALIAAKKRGPYEPNSHHSQRNAMQILDERFARGEIDEAEYIRKKTVLKR